VTPADNSVRLLGDFLAKAYVTYGLGLLVLAYFGGNLLVLAIVLFVVIRRKKARTFRRLCEVGYGLLNPLVYLVVLRPGFESYEATLWKTLPLQMIAWCVLALIWTIRIAGASLANRQSFVWIRRTVLWAAVICLVLFGIKDVFLIPRVGISTDPTSSIWKIGLEYTWLLAALAPLYLIPLVLTVGYLREDFETPITESGFFILQGRSARILGLSVSAFGIMSLAVASWRPSDDAGRRAVLIRRDGIRAAAAEFGVDPAVIASIVYVTHRYQITPFRGTVERLTMAVWLWDLKSNFLLGPALNISIGLTQIKPATAQTAEVLAINDGRAQTYNKEYREVPRLTWSLPHAVASHLSIPWQGRSGKEGVVATLMEDRGNLRACALILAVYQIQWESDPQGFAIRGRPDILGTLFQIGFERSHPNPAPRSNAFGRRIQQVHDSSWIQEAFR
jgi:hypothetical protein